MEIKCLPVGPLEANCWFVSEGPSGPCAVIDPGGDADRLLQVCADHDLQVQFILLTHGHVDHVAAVAALQEATGATVWIHHGDRAQIEKPHPYFAQMVGGVNPCVPDGELVEGQEIGVEGARLTIWHTPGHSPGCVCFAADGVIFTGDTLFAGSVGRTDLPGGSWAVLQRSLKRILEAATSDTIICPGHGEASTIGEEVASNPFLNGEESG
jgi:hydroxyacylglutathione hydrolase